MSRARIGIALGALLAFSMPPSQAVARDPAIVALASTPLTIATARGPRRFVVEQAISPAEQERGLMYRRHMAANRGMIFPMTPPRPASFWMQNTYLPLDLIFIGPDRRIVQIAARATPLSTATIDCLQPVAAVLELNGGAAARAGIREGDKVAW